MKKIYLLKSILGNKSIFIHIQDNHIPISIQAMEQKWQPFSENYKPVKLKLYKSDEGKKNFQFDFCSFLAPFYIFSDKAVDVLGDILRKNGQILSVITESKRKRFWGYYPTNLIVGCFDKNNSLFRAYEKGLVIDKVSLIASKVPDDDLFTIEEDISSTFVNENFKECVKKNKLYGFDFSIEIHLSKDYM